MPWALLLFSILIAAFLVAVFRPPDTTPKQKQRASAPAPAPLPTTNMVRISPIGCFDNGNGYCHWVLALDNSTDREVLLEMSDPSRLIRLAPGQRKETVFHKYVGFGPRPRPSCLFIKALKSDALVFPKPVEPIGAFARPDNPLNAEVDRRLEISISNESDHDILVSGFGKDRPAHLKAGGNGFYQFTWHGKI